MTKAAKLFWAGVIIILAAGAVASQFIPALDTPVSHDRHTANAGELTAEVLVGQTITAEANDFAAVSIMFATYSGRNNTEPIYWHLRSSTDSSEDIRTAQIDPRELGDNQLYTIRFEPIPDSAGKQYFFFVVSPTSSHGNAVTVDVDTRDPYHLGSAYVVRGQGPNVTDPGALGASGKRTQDVVFALHYEVPLRMALTNTTLKTARSFLSGWQTSRAVYLAYGRGLIAAVIFFAVIGIARRLEPNKRLLTTGVLTALVLIGCVFRWQYARELPITNDEGNYLYDAFSIRQGVLAGGDGYVKAPLVIAWIALWQALLGNTVIAGRFASVVAGAALAIPLYILARQLWSHRTGLVVATAWAVFGAPVVATIYAHTQTLALFFAVSGLATLTVAVRNKPKTWLLLQAGALLGLGVASRKSILAVGLAALVIILIQATDWRSRSRYLVTVGLSFLAVIALFLGTAYFVYGPEGVWEAIGYSSAEDSLGSIEDADPEEVRAYSIRGMTPFFRESLPLIALSLLGLGFSIEYALRAMGTRWNIARAHVWARLGWIAPWLVFWWAWQFFFEYEGAVFMGYGISFLWWAIGGLLLVATLWPDPREKHPKQAHSALVIPGSTQPGFHGQGRQDPSGLPQRVLSLRKYIAAALFVPLWAGGLVFFYMNWIKFHANYISEFIPVLTLLAGFGAIAFGRRLAPHLFWHKDHPWADLMRGGLRIAAVLVLTWMIAVTSFITFFFEHTGTFYQGSVAQAATWARDHIPAEERIFTGAALIPYVSGHRISLDIAHPRWYAYEFTRKNTERLNTFLPPIPDMIESYRQANWFLLDQQTAFSFLQEYSEIESGLSRDWEKVHEVENGGNPLTFYRRIR